MAPPATFTQNFVSRIGELRRDSELSQRELAHAVGVSENTIAGWEKAIPKPFAIAFKICAFFNPEIEAQFGGDNFQALQNIAHLRERMPGEQISQQQLGQALGLEDRKQASVESVSQRQLAQTIGVTNNTISTWERGHNKTVGKLQKLCAALNCELTDLYRQSVPLVSSKQPNNKGLSSSRLSQYQAPAPRDQPNQEKVLLHREALSAASSAQHQDFSNSYSLREIFGLSLCAIIAGAETWLDIFHYGNAKRIWLQQVLRSHQHDLPTPGEMAHLFACLTPTYLENNIQDWNQEITNQNDALNPLHKSSPPTNQLTDNTSPLNCTVWLQAQRLTLANPHTSSPPPSVSQLLAGLDIAQKQVLIDTPQTPLALAKQVISQGGNYIIHLTHQDNLYENAQQLLAWAISKSSEKLDFYQSIEDGGHDRPEIRRHWILNQTEYLTGIDQWPHLESIGLVESTQDFLNAPSHVERRYYLTSIATSAKEFASSTYAHWNIHSVKDWLLDISKAASKSDGESTEILEVNKTNKNLELLRNYALSFLEQDSSTQGGLKAKRLKAGWDDQYLLNLITQTDTEKAS